MAYLYPLDPAGGEDDLAPDQYETGEVLAICRMEAGRPVIEELAYFRMTAGPEGIMFAVAPMRDDDVPDTVVGDADLRTLDGIHRCHRSPSRFLRRLFGTAARLPATPDSIGDLLARRMG